VIHYPRKELAVELVTALLGKALFGDAHNGLFLAAPRRTGKSTFLQADLQPALEAAGAVVVYVDLWADRRRDPGQLISEAIGRALGSKLGLVARAAKSAKLENVTIAGALKIDVSKIGKTDGMTLPDALRMLHDQAKSPVALIVDEAQHALTSEGGESTMAALKSARDQLNKPDQIHLMLVMSGSDRDKLLRLVNTNGAPFFGSQISKMPTLDKAFITHIEKMIAAQRPELAPVNTDVLTQAFECFGYRPQFFMDALGNALSPFADLGGQRFEQAVMNAALRRQDDDEAQMESEFLGLSRMERVVLWRLLDQGRRFRPYDAESLKFYRKVLDEKITPQVAQKAVEALRERTPALVWKSARGEYALDDAAMHRWYERRVEDGRWPPSDPQSELEFNPAS
jgi:hypothetical protein